MSEQPDDSAETSAGAESDERPETADGAESDNDEVLTAVAEDERLQGVGESIDAAKQAAADVDLPTRDDET